MSSRPFPTSRSSRWPQAARIASSARSRAAHGVELIALADGDAAARARGTLLGTRARRRLGARDGGRGRHRPERVRRRGGARGDARGPRRGHRRRAREQGEPRRRRPAGARRRRAQRRRPDPGRLRALGAAPAPARRVAGIGRVADPHRLGGPVPGQHARRARRGLGRGRAAPPDLGHGRAHHGGLGDPHEQGPRGDRGPPALRRAVRRASRSSCSRSRSCTRSSG